MTMRTWRIVLGSLGVLLAAFGAFRLLTEVSAIDVVVLAGWLIGAVIVHDGVLSPLVLATGALVSKVPPRARRYLQFALVAGGLIAVIGLILVARRGSQPRVKALLLRDYGVNLAILLGIVAAGSLLAYAVRVARESRAGAVRDHGGDDD